MAFAPTLGNLASSMSRSSTRISGVLGPARWSALDSSIWLRRSARERLAPCFALKLDRGLRDTSRTLRHRLSDAVLQRHRTRPGGQRQQPMGPLPPVVSQIPAPDFPRIRFLVHPLVAMG